MLLSCVGARGRGVWGSRVEDFRPDESLHHKPAMGANCGYAEPADTRVFRYRQTATEEILALLPQLRKLVESEARGTRTPPSPAIRAQRGRQPGRSRSPRGGSLLSA